MSLRISFAHHYDSHLIELLFMQRRSNGDCKRLMEDYEAALTQIEAKCNHDVWRELQSLEDVIREVYETKERS